MSTEIETRDAMISKALAQYNVTDAAIEEMRVKFMPLQVAGLDDRKGLAAVHDARMIVRNVRVGIEKKRVELKADALKFGQAVDAEARRITGRLQEIESALEERESIVQREKDRIAAEAAAAKQARLDGRMVKLAALGSTLLPSVVDALSDADFATALAAAQDEHAKREAARIEAEAEARRVAEAEAAVRRAESERLTVERAELEKQREAARQDAIREQAVRDAEMQRLQAERKAVEAQRRAVEMEAAKAEAARRAVAAEEERKRLAAEEAARREAMRPEIERVHAFKLALLAMEVPSGAYQAQVKAIVARAAQEIEGLVRQ